MKRFSVVLLSVVLGLAMMTAFAFAEENVLHVSTLEDMNNAINDPWDVWETSRTIILDSDLSLQSSDGSGAGEMICFNNEGKYTLDLNGHTVSKTFSGSESGKNEPIIQNGDGTVTITGNGTVKYINEGNAGDAVENLGKLTIENGTFEAFHAVNNDGNCVINNGSFTGYYALYNNSDKKLTINNADVHSRYFEYDSIYGKTEHQCVMDSTFFSQKGGTTIQGGTFDSGDSTYGAIGAGRVFVKGGVFKGQAAVLPDEVNIDTYLNISGGDFTGSAAFFGKEYATQLIVIDSDHLIVKNAKLTEAQQTEINHALQRGEAAKQERKNATPVKVKISKVTSIKKGFKVSYKKAKKAEKYQISYRLKNANKWTTVGTKKTSATIKKLKSKKNYQVKVRGVRDYGFYTLYGPWSSVKTVKVK